MKKTIIIIFPCIYWGPTLGKTLFVLVWYCLLLFEAKINIVSALHGPWKYRRATSTCDFNISADTRNSPEEHVDRGYRKNTATYMQFFPVHNRPVSLAILFSRVFGLQIQPQQGAALSSSCMGVGLSTAQSMRYYSSWKVNCSLDCISRAIHTQSITLASTSQRGDHRRITARYHGVYFERLAIMRC